MNQNWEEIIWRALRNECSSEELMKLQEWRNETPDNEQMYEDIKGIAGMGNFLKGIDSLHKENALENILKRTRQRSLGHSRLLKYVAVFLLPLLLGGTLFYFLKFKQQAGEKLPVSVAKQILPGGPKAILYLSDGQVIDLNRTIDSVIVDKHSGQEITLSKDINALNYSGVTGNTTQPKELAYNRIEVPRGGEYMLVLSDGTKVWLNSETRLEYPLTFGEYSRDVRLSGEAYFDVKRDEALPFVVKTSRSEVMVLGTEFCVKDYANQVNQTTLVSGSVSVKDFRGQSYVIVPGQQVCIDQDSSRVLEVETLYFTSWKDGYFMFDQATLERIMDELARWYNFDYFFANAEARNMMLTARIKKYDNIDTVLDILSRTGDIRFSRKGNTITIVSR